MSVCVLFKQKTAYELRISDWSSDVCSSDLFRTCLGDLGERLFGGRIDRLEPRPALRLDQLPPDEQAVPLVELDDLGGLGRVGVLPHRRSAEGRVGTECVSTCRSPWSPYTYQPTHPNQYRT